MGLRDSIAAMREPEHGLMLTQRAESLPRDAYVHLYKMSRTGAAADLIFCRTEAHEVFGSLGMSL
jgi:hypothetical protein